MGKQSNGGMKEAKEQVFARLAIARTSKALKAIRMLENLKNYPHDSQKSNQIVTALKGAVDKLEYALGGDGEPKQTDEFAFEE